MGIVMVARRPSAQHEDAYLILLARTSICNVQDATATSWSWPPCISTTRIRVETCLKTTVVSQMNVLKKHT